MNLSNNCAQDAPFYILDSSEVLQLVFLKATRAVLAIEAMGLMFFCGELITYHLGFFGGGLFNCLGLKSQSKEKS